MNTGTPSPLRNGNRQGDYNTAPRCGAKTRAATPCKSPAMKNGRCRMHGGKCRGPTTAEGRARISAARDQGKGWSIKWKPINYTHAVIVRRARVFEAMGRAKMALPEVAPLIRDLRGALGKNDPNDAADSPASAALYAAEAILALSHDRLAMRSLTHAIHEVDRLRRAERRLARPESRKPQKNAMHRENARAEAAAPQTTPPPLNGQDRRTEFQPSRSGSGKTQKNAMHREGARSEAAMRQTVPPTQRGSAPPNNPAPPARENPERMPCTEKTHPPPTLLNRKQRRRLAKFAKTSLAPRAARPSTGHRVRSLA